MRKLLALLLSISLLAGCIGLGVHAAAEGDTAPFRVVCSYAGEDGKTMGFHWYTKADCDSIVAVDGKEYTGTSKKFKGNYAHSAVVGDLTPGAHRYQIGDYTGTFNINPGKGEAVNFIVTGDVQASIPENFAYSAAAIDAAWEMFPDAEFQVNLGDFTNDSDNEQWDMYFDAFEDIHAQAALVPVSGNHDGNLKWNWFRNMFTLKEPDNFWSNLTGVYYSFDYGDAHIAVLNTNDMYPITRAQINWLRNDMNSSNAKWKLVMMHRSPYSAGKNGIKPDNLIMRRELMPVFDELGIDLVMYGHDHNYARTMPMKGDKPAGPAADAYTDPAGTVYIMPAVVSAKRYDTRDNIMPAVGAAMVKNANPGMPVFTNVSIDGDILTYKAFTYNPETKASESYDSVSITKTRYAEGSASVYSESFWLTLPQQLGALIADVFLVIFADYLFTLVPKLIKGA